MRHGANPNLCYFEGCKMHIISKRACALHDAMRCRHSDGCSNLAINNGVCQRHGAILKRCNVEGCNSVAKRKGGLCERHAGKKVCNFEGCTSHAINNGVCVKHGAEGGYCTMGNLTVSCIQSPFFFEKNKKK